jgi:hypothetical protein
MKCPKCGGEFEEGMCEILGLFKAAGLRWYPGLTKDSLKKNPSLMGKKSVRLRGPIYYQQMFFCHRCPECEALFVEYGKAKKKRGDGG